MDRLEYEARVAERVAAAQEVLQAEVSSLVTGEDWVRFLEVQSRLHAYSPNNIMLICAQHAQAHAEGRVPVAEPSCIAGFRTWQALGRNVERGQHGYVVLAPLRRTRRLATDQAGNTRLLARGDTPSSGEVESRSSVLRGFGVEHVFDVSQTQGAPLPEQPHPRLLEGEAPADLGRAVMEMIEARGYTVSTVPDAGQLGGANGRTHYDARTVVIRADMDDAAMVKTLIHEAAHVLLHEAPPGRYLPRHVKEVEAESVAYVVASVHGMTTDGYSFPYVAGWAGERGAQAVTDTQARVAHAAKAIITVSPAEHTLGGKPPGADRAAEMIRSARENVREFHPATRIPTGGLYRSGSGVMAAVPVRSEHGVDGSLLSIVAGMLTVGILWAAGVASAVLSGHQVPHGRPFGELSAFAHAGDPSVGWDAPVGPAGALLDGHRHRGRGVLGVDMGGMALVARGERRDRRSDPGRGFGGPPAGDRHRRVEGAADPGEPHCARRSPTRHRAISATSWALERDRVLGVGRGLDRRGRPAPFREGVQPGDPGHPRRPRCRHHDQYPGRQPGRHHDRPSGRTAGGGVRPPRAGGGPVVVAAMVADPGLRTSADGDDPGVGVVRGRRQGHRVGELLAAADHHRRALPAPRRRPRRAQPGGPVPLVAHPRRRQGGGRHPGRHPGGGAGVGPGVGRDHRRRPPPAGLGVGHGRQRLRRPRRPPRPRRRVTRPSTRASTPPPSSAIGERCTCLAPPPGRRPPPAWSRRWSRTSSRSPAGWRPPRRAPGSTRPSL